MSRNQQFRISSGVKITYGFVDQGLFSIANYAASIYLARLVNPDDYGVFSIVFSVFLVISMVQVSFFGEPISIFGARDHAETLVDYLNSMFWTQIILSAATAVGATFFLLLLPNDDLRKSLLSMTVSLPFILSYWFLRRAYYIQMQTHLAVFSSLIYAILLAIFLFFLGSMDALNSSTIFIAMGAASLLASLLSYSKLGIRLSFILAIKKNLAWVKIHFLEGFAYGKWLLVGSFASWVATNAYPLVIGIFMGIDQAGAYRAIQNIFLPMQQAIAAVTLLAIPVLSKQAEKGEARLKRWTLLLVSGAFVVCAVYGLLAWIFNKPLIDLLYDNEFYYAFESLIPAYGFYMTALAVATVLSYYLRIFGKQKSVMWSKVISAAFFLVFGILLILFMGLKGIIITLILSILFELLYIAIASFGEKNEPRRSGSEAG